VHIHALTRLRFFSFLSPFQLGRAAFKHILVDVTQRQRRTYESFLSGVPLLADLDAYDRSAMADCLLELSFAAGQEVIRQGDAGDAFYLLLEGDAAAVVADSGAPGGVKEVMKYTAVRARSGGAYCLIQTRALFVL
jgi:hypothetical protein